MKKLIFSFFLFFLFLAAEDFSNTSNKKVVLTFDDGPSPYTKEILKILEEFQVKAVFFLIGEKVQRNPETIALIINAGHQIGNHTFSHPRVTKISISQFEKEIEKTNEAVRKAVGKEISVKFFRFPYGAKDPQKQKIIEEKGMKVVWWSIDVRDWKKPSLNASHNDLVGIVEKIIKRVKPGGIILLHERKNTVEALPQLLEKLQEEGWKFSPLN